MLSTHDGGSTWQTQASGKDSILSAATFTDDGQRGWAVGVDGTILNTRDGATPGSPGERHQELAFRRDVCQRWTARLGHRQRRNDSTHARRRQHLQAQSSGSTRGLRAVTFSSDGQRGWAVGREEQS